MAGLFIPFVMIPRFTSYVGEAVYTSVTLDVSDYASFTLTIWRGPLVGSPASGAALSLIFEDSDDAEVWAQVPGTSAITTANANSVVEGAVMRRFLRMKLTLTGDADDVVAISSWAMGHLEKRESA